MADPQQLALIKRSIKDWNTWRDLEGSTINLRGANLQGADLQRADLRGANLHNANLIEADLTGTTLQDAFLPNANLTRAIILGSDIRDACLEETIFREAKLIGSYLNFSLVTGADFTEADLRRAKIKAANLTGANLTEADLTGTNLTGADLTGADLTGIILIKTNLTRVKGLHSSTQLKSQSSQPPSTTNWLSLVETFGSNLLTTAVTFAAIIQGLDVVERRWREKKKKQKQQSTQSQSSSAASTQSASSSSSKTPDLDKEITEICLVMDDGSHQSLKRWVSDPDILRNYIDAFNNPKSKVKPLQVVFMKREGRALVVDVTAGAKDNKPLNVILDYLEADPQ